MLSGSIFGQIDAWAPLTWLCSYWQLLRCLTRCSKLTFYFSVPRISPFCVLACMLSGFSCVRLFETSWTVVCQAPLWDSPGKNTRVGCHSLLQGIFLSQGSNCVSCTAGRFFTMWGTREAGLKLKTDSERSQRALWPGVLLCVEMRGRNKRQWTLQMEGGDISLCALLFSHHISLPLLFTFFVLFSCSFNFLPNRVHHNCILLFSLPFPPYL